LPDAPGLVDAFEEAKTVLRERIEVERKREADEDRIRSGRFE
jgi:hypothetical protein